MTAFLCFIALFFLWSIVLATGLLRVPSGGGVDGEELPSVSVLVSCRNEETDLPRCIRSLESLDYPSDKLEVLLVDDLSTDRTSAIIHQAVGRNSNFRSLRTYGWRTKLQAKSRGIARAASEATGEWLFITDADAKVHPRWLRAMLGRRNSNTGLLGGAVVSEGKHGNLIHTAERLVNATASVFCLGMSGWGLGGFSWGPNMAIRADVYRGQGGLEAVDFKIAEDMALWRLAQRAGTRWTLCADPEAVVRVRPVPSFTHLLSQLRRWLGGGKQDSPMPIRAATYFVGLLAFLVGLGVCVGWVEDPILWGIAVLLKLIADAVILGAAQLRLRISRLIPYAPLASIVLIAIYIWLPLSLVIDPRISWRGSGYAIRF